MNTEHYRYTYVGIEDFTPVKAWIRTDADWNGFVIPVFDKANARIVAEYFDLIYDADNDKYWENDDMVLENGIELENRWGWEGEFNEELQTHVYPIGAREWIWSECNPEIDALVAEYSEWVKVNDLPEMSADELIMQTETGELDDSPLITTEEQRDWLRRFIERWEEAES